MSETDTASRLGKGNILVGRREGLTGVGETAEPSVHIRTLSSPDAQKNSAWGSRQCPFGPLFTSDQLPVHVPAYDVGCPVESVVVERFGGVEIELGDLLVLALSVAVIVQLHAVCVLPKNSKSISSWGKPSPNGGPT